MILDTNAYSALVLGKPQILEALASVKRIGLPLPVIAELKQGFLSGTRAEANLAKLEQFMAQDGFDVIVPDMATTEHYAYLQHYAKRNGRVLSNNDLWIAALTVQDGDILLTYDHDFEVFRGLMTDRLIIL